MAELDETGLSTSSHADHGRACTCDEHAQSRPVEAGRRGVVRRLLGFLARFGGWWLGMSGLVATFSVCPCCGQPTCPVGAVGVGAIGAFLAMTWKRARRVFTPG
jgi:hypothetical protein